MNNEKNNMAAGQVDLSIPTTKILTIGRWKDKGMVLSHPF